MAARFEPHHVGCRAVEIADINDTLEACRKAWEAEHDPRAIVLAMACLYHMQRPMPAWLFKAAKAWLLGLIEEEKHDPTKTRHRAS